MSAILGSVGVRARPLARCCWPHSGEIREQSRLSTRFPDLQTDHSESLFPECLFASLPYAACTRLRNFSCCFSLTRPSAIANITSNANPQRSLIFFRPRIKWFSKPKETSSRLFTRSTAVRLLYCVCHA